MLKLADKNSLFCSFISLFFFHAVHCQFYRVSKGFFIMESMMVYVFSFTEFGMPIREKQI